MSTTTSKQTPFKTKIVSGNKEQKKSIKNPKNMKTSKTSKLPCVSEEIEDIKDNEDIENKEDFEADIEHFRKTLTVPVSDDALDQLERQIDIMNDTTNLSEKVRLQTSLVSHTKQLEAAIDSMVDMIDQIDVNAASEAFKKENNDANGIDVSDNVASLDKLLSKLKNEDVAQIKIMYMIKITDIIAKCKATCERNRLVVSKCN